MGHTYMKAAYRGFTDETFTTPAPQQNPTDGLLGPYIHAEVGDLITVVFKVATRWHDCNQTDAKAFSSYPLFLYMRIL